MEGPGGLESPQPPPPRHFIAYDCVLIAQRPIFIPHSQYITVITSMLQGRTLTLAMSTSVSWPTSKHVYGVQNGRYEHPRWQKAANGYLLYASLVFNVYGRIS